MNNTINEKELKEALDSIKDNIPKVIIPPKTIFNVMKQPHLENVWSNIYAFFFNPNEEHDLETLFLDSLIELIIDKEGRNLREMRDIDVKTEDCTIDGKRVDILLKSDDKVIIIENKVYASLYNSLDSYWNNYKNDRNNKQGVVLSLYPITIKEKDRKNWVNITHSELMEAISPKLTNTKIPKNYKILLSEFIQNIESMNNPINPEAANFYIANTSDIEKVWKISEKIKTYVANEIKKIQVFDKNTGFYEMSHCKGIYFHNNKKGGRKEHHVVIAVICKNLYTKEHQVKIAVEILGNDFIKDFYKHINDIFKETDNYPNMVDAEKVDAEKVDAEKVDAEKVDAEKIDAEKVNSKRGWAHVCSYNVKITDLKNISEVVSEKINEKIDGKYSLKEVFNEIDKYHDIYIKNNPNS